MKSLTYVFHANVFELTLLVSIRCTSLTCVLLMQNSNIVSCHRQLIVLFLKTYLNKGSSAILLEIIEDDAPKNVIKSTVKQESMTLQHVLCFAEDTFRKR